SPLKIFLKTYAGFKKEFFYIKKEFSKTLFALFYHCATNRCRIKDQFIIITFQTLKTKKPMPSKPWSYFQDPFLNATDTSYKLGMEISSFHYSALKAGIADPFILSRFNAYDSAHQAYVTAYKAWDMGGGAQEG